MDAGGAVGLPASSLGGRLRSAHAVLVIKCSAALRRAPCLAVCASVILVQIPLVLFPDLSPFAAGFLALPAALLPLLFFPVRDVFYCFALPALAGLISVLMFLDRIRNDPLREAMVSSCAAGEAELEMIDSALSPGPGSPGVPNRILARTRRIRFTGEEEWRILSSRVFVSMRPGEEREKFSPGYGDVYRMKGLFLEPEKGLFPGAYDDAAYLRRRGVQALFRADSAERILEGNGFYSNLLRLRGILLDRITGPMKNADAKALAAAILFGLPQGLSREMKQDFIRSGTVHILTVSGTHVAMFTSLLFLLFAFVSFRPRCMLALVLTFFYAWLTGLREPAFRAFLMLALLLGSRLMLYRSSPLNSLALAGGVLLLLNPGNLTSPGFQYSFLVVAALLLSMQPLYHLFRALMIPDASWTPSQYMTRALFRRRRVLAFLFGTLGASAIAFCASIALSARYQGIFTGSAVAANFLLLPFTFSAFLTAFPALLFGSVFSVILEWIFRVFSRICSAFSETGVFDFATVPLWSVFLFLTCFFLMLLPFRGKAWCQIIRPAAFVLLPLTAFFWYFHTVSADPEVAVLYGGRGDGVCSLILTEPGRRQAYLVNLPDFPSGRFASVFLRSRGISECCSFLAERDRKSCVYGLRFLSGISLGEALIGVRQRKYAGGIAVQDMLYPRKASFSSGVWNLERSPDSFRFEIAAPDVPLCGEWRTLKSGKIHCILRNGYSGKILLDREFPCTFRKKYLVLNWNTGKEEFFQ